MSLHQRETSYQAQTIAFLSTKSGKELCHYPVGTPPSLALCPPVAAPLYPCLSSLAAYLPTAPPLGTLGNLSGGSLRVSQHKGHPAYLAHP
ncbi:hypothetical protein FKM82_030003 [Ascaphus truei]